MWIQSTLTYQGDTKSASMPFYLHHYNTSNIHGTDINIDYDQWRMRSRVGWDKLGAPVG